MATNTPNIGLNKDDPTEQYDVTRVNNNSDILDTEVIARTKYKDHAELASTSSINAVAITDVPGMTVSITAVAGHHYRIMLNAGVLGSVAGDRAIVHIREGSTVIKSVQSCELADASSSYEITLIKKITPSAGAHTYKVSLSRHSGTGNIEMAGASSELSIEDLGPGPF